VELLLLKGHLAEDGGVAAVGANDVADGGLEAEVVGLEALALGAEQHVVRTVLLRLHLRAPVLEPELHLPGFQPQLLAQLEPLLVVRMQALLEQPAMEMRQSSSYEHGKEKLIEDDTVLTLPSAGSDAPCAGGTASSCR
jgi:hypothetical protein